MKPPAKGNWSWIHGNIRVICVVALVAGCSALFVPATDDPVKKLEYAKELLGVGRSVPAERLIRESIEIFRDEDNESGLADAYRAYGLFFVSKAVTKRKNYYEDHGFDEKSAVWFKRYDKAVEYLRKAADLFRENERYKTAAEVYLEMGFAYKLMEAIQGACDAYDAGLRNNKQGLAINPDAEAVHPKRFDSYENYVNDLRERLHCD